MGHVVWTLDEVKKAVPDQEVYWLSDCGCRKSAEKPCKTTVRVCLGFKEGLTSSQSNLGKIDRREVNRLLALAKSEKLVPRPWVNEKGAVEALCFCCSCCCSYLHGAPDCVNVAGPSEEATDETLCSSCGACGELCYFGARKISGGKLKVDKSKCYGCGLCVDACPAGAVKMKPR